MIVRQPQMLQMSAVETGQMFAVETGQMSAAGTGQMSAVETRQMLKSQIRGRAQNHQNGPKWVENGRQVLRIHPNGSHGRSQAFGTAPAAQSTTTNLKSFRGTPPLQFQQDRYKIDTAMWQVI